MTQPVIGVPAQSVNYDARQYLRAGVSAGAAWAMALSSDAIAATLDALLRDARRSGPCVLSRAGDKILAVLPILPLGVQPRPQPNGLCCLSKSMQSAMK